MAKVSDRRLVFVDVETTGLDPLTQEILEYAIITEWSSGLVTECAVKVLPNHIETAHPKALEVNGYTPEKWMLAGAQSQKEAAVDIGLHLKFAAVVGHNIPFDMSFFQETLKREGVTVSIGHLNIDTMTLAYEHLVPLGLQSMSLKAICEFIGIQPEADTHEALAGARKCREVYQRLARATWFDRMRWKWNHRNDVITEPKKKS